MRMNKKETSLSREQVAEYINYDSEAGRFTWKKSPNRKRYDIGDEAGISLKSKKINAVTGEVVGYRYIGLHGIQVPAARIAWLLINGVWPARPIEFKDGNIANFKFDNLKEKDVMFPSIKSIKNGKRHFKMSRNSQRHYGLKRYYGLSMETYEVMLASQNGVCAICHGTETYQPKSYDGPKALSVDHNHETGEIRGLLCSNCNYLVGHCKEDRNVLLAAIAYLDKYNGKAAPKLSLVPTPPIEDQA